MYQNNKIKLINKQKNSKIGFHMFRNLNNIKEFNIEEIKFGDVVSKDLYNGYAQHFGWVCDKQAKNITICQFVKVLSKNKQEEKSKIMFIDLDNFMGSDKILYIYERSNLKDDDILKNYQKIKNFGDYNIITNNCEHFVNFVVRGDRRSDQINPLNKYKIIGKFIYKKDNN